jgi:hypothetical protein
MIASFRVIAQGARLVEDAGTLPFGLFKQVGGIKIFAVEGRVFAHEHGIERRERCTAQGLRLKPVGGITREDNVPHPCSHLAAALPDQILRQADRQRVPAPLCFAHHGKGGVFVDLEAFQRIGDEQ